MTQWHHKMGPTGTEVGACDCWFESCNERCPCQCHSHEKWMGHWPSNHDPIRKGRRVGIPYYCGLEPMTFNYRQWELEHYETTYQVRRARQLLGWLKDRMKPKW